MKRIKHPAFGAAIPLGRLSEVAIPHPERTARRCVGWDYEIAEWPSRGAMLTTVRMQERGPASRFHWKPVQP
jgi:hypothetical protein